MSLVRTLQNKMAGSVGGSFPISSDSYRGAEPWYFWDNDGFVRDTDEHVFRYSGHTSSLTAYQHCPPLTSIIDRKAQAYINGKTWVMNSQGKESQTPEAKKLRKLFAKPNPIQSWKQFEAQQEIYIQLFGFCIVLPIVPIGFERYGPIEATSMWNIPPFMVDIKETNKLFYQTDQSGIIESIVLVYRGERTPLKINSLYIFKDISPSFNTLIFPESRVCSIEMPINNIIGALECENVLINYRGALGAWTMEPSQGQYVNTLSTKDKEQLQHDFSRYGLKKHQWKFIISSSAIRWQQAGVPTKDLMLSEMLKENTQMICDRFNYPPHLLGLIDPTFNNQLEAGKGLYQNAIIPEAESNYEQWNNLFNTADLNINIQKDYSHLPILQEDAAKQATARKTRNEALQIEFYMNMITLNRWLELNNEDTLTTPEGKLYYRELIALGWKFGTTAAPPNNNNSNQNNQNQNNNANNANQ